MTAILVSIDPGSYITGACLWTDNTGPWTLVSTKKIEIKKRYGKYAMSAPERCAEIVRRLDKWVDNLFGAPVSVDAVAYEAPQVPGQNQKALTMMQGAIAGWAGLRGATIFDYHQATLKSILLRPPHTKEAAQKFVLARHPHLKNRSPDELDAVFAGMAHIAAMAT